LDLEGASEHPLYPAALVTAANLAATRGEVQSTEHFCDAALDAVERVGARTAFLDFWLSFARAAVATHVGAFAAAAARFEQCVEIARTGGLADALTRSLGTVALNYVYAGDLDRAAPYAAEAVALARLSAGPTTLLLNLAALAGALSVRDPEQARSLLDEAVRLADRFTDARMGATINTVVLAAARLGDWDQALRLASQPIRDYHWLGLNTLLGAVLTVVARALATSDAQSAARLQGAARRLMTPPRPEGAASPIPDQSTPGERSAPGDTSQGAGITRDLYRGTTAILRDGLAEAQLRELRSEGAALDDDQVLALAFDAIARTQTETHP
jgi:tetratricopeptide (TPR) repeat protein